MAATVNSFSQNIGTANRASIAAYRTFQRETTAAEVIDANNAQETIKACRDELRKLLSPDEYKSAVAHACRLTDNGGEPDLAEIAARLTSTVEMHHRRIEQEGDEFVEPTYRDIQ